MTVAAEVWEVIWHTLAVFLVVLIVSRIIDKKLLAPITHFDSVVTPPRAVPGTNCSGSR
jgi:uncharacterized membrane protein YcaP (DUF421 family)